MRWANVLHLVFKSFRPRAKKHRGDEQSASFEHCVIIAPTIQARHHRVLLIPDQRYPIRHRHHPASRIQAMYHQKKKVQLQ